MLPVLAKDPWDTDAQVPKDVSYKRADKAVVREAVEYARTILGPNYKGSEHLLADVVVVGPYLWRRLQPLPAFAANPGEQIDFKVSLPDRDRLGHGRALKDTTSDLALELELRQELAQDRGFQVRKLHADEILMLAQLVPFELEEPILMLESSHHRFVLIVIDHKDVMVDDLNKARLEDLKI